MKINLEVVERGYQKLRDILSKSNPWENNDCRRKDCFICHRSLKCKKLNFKSCFKRSIVYETWCQMCKMTHKNVETDEDLANIEVCEWLDKQRMKTKKRTEQLVRENWKLMVKIRPHLSLYW